MKGEAAAALWEFDRELGVPLCGLDEAGVRERFHLILPSWSND